MIKLLILEDIFVIKILKFFLKFCIDILIYYNGLSVLKEIGLCKYFLRWSIIGYN